MKELPPHGWPNWVLGNHDKPRIKTRLGPHQARVAAMLLLMLRGTPTLYYGDEIGMEAVPIAPDMVQDPWEKNIPGLGLGRDPSRTPMQWDASPHAGFTSGLPWLPLATDFETTNVARERADPASLLTLYRRLIAVRRAEPALRSEAYQPMASTDRTLVYLREAANRRWLIALNLSSDPVTVSLDRCRMKARCHSRPRWTGKETGSTSACISGRTRVFWRSFRISPNERDSAQSERTHVRRH